MYRRNVSLYSYSDEVARNGQYRTDVAWLNRGGRTAVRTWPRRPAGVGHRLGGRTKKRRSAHGNEERRTETGLRGDVVSDGVTTRARTWPDVSKRRRSSRTRHRLVYGRDSYGCGVGTSDVEVYTL